MYGNAAASTMTLPTFLTEEEQGEDEQDLRDTDEAISLADQERDRRVAEDVACDAAAALQRLEAQSQAVLMLEEERQIRVAEEREDAKARAFTSQVQREAHRRSAARLAREEQARRIEDGLVESYLHHFGSSLVIPKNSSPPNQEQECRVDTNEKKLAEKQSKVITPELNVRSIYENFEDRLVSNDSELDAILARSRNRLSIFKP